MRHFKLSLAGHAVSIMTVTGIAVFGVCLGLHRGVIQETCLTTLALWAVFTVYFWMALYGGFRFDKGLVEWRMPWFSMEDASKIQNIVGIPDVPDFDIEGVLGVIVFIFLVVAFTIAMVFLIWIGVNVAIVSFFTLFFAVYSIFRRGLRLVMVNGRRCKGDYLKSLYVSALHSFGYALLFGALVFAIESAARSLRHSDSGW